MSRSRMDGEHVQVGVGHLEAGDDQRHPGGGEHRLLGASHVLGHHHQMGGEVVVQVDPVVHLRHRHDQRVSRGDRGDGEERRTDVVAVDEPAGELAGEDAGEDRAHGTRIVECPAWQRRQEAILR